MSKYARVPISVQRGENDWTACRYPDGNPNHYPMGFGETQQEALDDLEENELAFSRICLMNGYRPVELDEIVVSDVAAIDAVCLLSEKGLNWPDKDSKLTCIRAVSSLCKSLENHKIPAHTEERLKSACEANGLIRLAADEVVVKRATAERVVISAELATWLRDMFLDAARRASGSKFAHPDYVIGVGWVCGQKCLDVAADLTAALEREVKP